MINKILLVDDIQDNLDLLEDLLDDEFNYGEYEYKVESTQTTRAKDALKIIQNDNSFDLILLDVMMPDMDGFELCKILKSDENTKHIPIIFITAKSDSDDIVKGFELGASDYVSKPFSPEELIARVKKELKIKSLINHLEYIASHDPMTGIYNRRKFFELSLKNFSNHQNNLYAIMVDIDKFKAVNDTYGHHIGDKVIIIVANTIKNSICKDTIFGRLGGEEFAIICTNPSEEKVQQLVEKIRVDIESLELLNDDNTIIKFTISLGIKKATNEIIDLDELLKDADEALYEAKRSGRNKSIFRGR